MLCSHEGGKGALDESARRLSHSELAVARVLAAEGHQVRSVAELPGRSKTADLDVCGVPVEVKALLPSSERDNRPHPRTVYNKLHRGAQQANDVVVLSAGSGLRASDARAGVDLFRLRGGAGADWSARVLGDGFDLRASKEQTLWAGRDVGRDASRGIA